MCASYLVLLAGDIMENPGPTISRHTCPTCLKTIRKNQGYGTCSSCKSDHHLKCLGADLERSQSCHLCSRVILSPNSSQVSYNLPDNLNHALNLRGLKIIHQPFGKSR